MRYKNGRTATMSWAVEIIKYELNTKVPMGKREKVIRKINEELQNSLKQVEIIDMTDRKEVFLIGGLKG